MESAHHEIACHHFWQAMLDLVCWYKQVCAGKDIENSNCWVFVQVITSVTWGRLVKFLITVRFLVVFQVSHDRQVEEKESVNQNEAKPLEVELWNDTESDFASGQKLIEVEFASLTTWFIHEFLVFLETILIISCDSWALNLILSLDLNFLDFKIFW